jgi:phage terminase small subunit
VARPRKPTAILEQNGAFDKDPQRRRTDIKSNEPVGDPPDWLSEPEQQIWREIVFEAPPGVFTASDRGSLAMRCELERKLQKRQLAASERTILVRLMAAHGATPADRSRVSSAPERKDDDPDNEFAR